MGDSVENLGKVTITLSVEDIEKLEMYNDIVGSIQPYIELLNTLDKTTTRKEIVDKIIAVDSVITKISKERNNKAKELLHQFKNNSKH